MDDSSSSDFSLIGDVRDPRQRESIDLGLSVPVFIAPSSSPSSSFMSTSCTSSSMSSYTFASLSASSSSNLYIFNCDSQASLVQSEAANLAASNKESVRNSCTTTALKMCFGKNLNEALIEDQLIRFDFAFDPTFDALSALVAGGVSFVKKVASMSRALIQSVHSTDLRVRDILKVNDYHFHKTFDVLYEMCHSATDSASSVPSPSSSSEQKGRIADPVQTQQSPHFNIIPEVGSYVSPDSIAFATGLHVLDSDDWLYPETRSPGAIIREPKPLYDDIYDDSLYDAGYIYPSSHASSFAEAYRSQEPELFVPFPRLHEKRAAFKILCMKFALESLFTWIPTEFIEAAMERFANNFEGIFQHFNREKIQQGEMVDVKTKEGGVLMAFVTFFPDLLPSDLEVFLVRNNYNFSDSFEEVFPPHSPQEIQEMSTQLQVQFPQRSLVEIEEALKSTSYNLGKTCIALEKDRCAFCGRVLRNFEKVYCRGCSMERQESQESVAENDQKVESEPKVEEKLAESAGVWTDEEEDTDQKVMLEPELPTLTRQPKQMEVSEEQLANARTERKLEAQEKQKLLDREQWLNVWENAEPQTLEFVGEVTKGVMQNCLETLKQVKSEPIFISMMSAYFVSRTAGDVVGEIVKLGLCKNLNISHAFPGSTGEVRMALAVRVELKCFTPNITMIIEKYVWDETTVDKLGPEFSLQQDMGQGSVLRALKSATCRLEQLNLADCSLGGMLHVFDLPEIFACCWSSFTSLYLSANALVASDFHELALALPKSPVRILDLSFNEALQGVKECGKLADGLKTWQFSVLGLAHCGLNDQGMQLISKSIRDGRTDTNYVRELNIRKNSISILPKRLGLLNLRIDAKGNPLRSPPLSVAQDPDRLNRWWADSNKGAVALKQTKLLIVGHSGAGKTTLKRRLLNLSPLDVQLERWGIKEVDNWLTSLGYPPDVHQKVLQVAPDGNKLLALLKDPSPWRTASEEMKFPVFSCLATRQQADTVSAASSSALSESSSASTTAPTELASSLASCLTASITSWFPISPSLLSSISYKPQIEMKDEGDEAPVTCNELVFRSLLAQLRHLVEEAKESASQNRQLYLSTVGITMDVWKPEGTGLEIQVMDFAGQPEYHSTHRPFLSDANSIFVVVGDATRPHVIDEMVQWVCYLRACFHKESKPVVQLCLTHMDVYSSHVGPTVKLCSALFAAARKAWSVVRVQILTHDLASTESAISIQNSVIASAKSQLEGVEVPQDYISFRDRVLVIRQEKLQRKEPLLLPRAELERIAKEEEERSQPDADWMGQLRDPSRPARMIEYLECVGLILQIKEQSVVVLSPIEFLARIMSYFVSHERGPLKVPSSSEGFVVRQDVTIIAPLLGCTNEVQLTQLLQLLSGAKICSFDEKSVFFPSLLTCTRVPSSLLADDMYEDVAEISGGLMLRSDHKIVSHVLLGLLHLRLLNDVKTFITTCPLFFNEFPLKRTWKWRRDITEILVEFETKAYHSQLGVCVELSYVPHPLEAAVMMPNFAKLQITVSVQKGLKLSVKVLGKKANWQPVCIPFLETLMEWLFKLEEWVRAASEAMFLGLSLSFSPGCISRNAKAENPCIKDQGFSVQTIEAAERNYATGHRWKLPPLYSDSESSFLERVKKLMAEARKQKLIQQKKQNKQKERERAAITKTEKKEDDCEHPQSDDGVTIHYESKPKIINKQEDQTSDQKEESVLGTFLLARIEGDEDDDDGDLEEEEKLDAQEAECRMDSPREGPTTSTFNSENNDVAASLALPGALPPTAATSTSEKMKAGHGTSSRSMQQDIIFMDELFQLSQMGFHDAYLNQVLLESYEGDLESVIIHLTSS